MWVCESTAWVGPRRLALGVGGGLVYLLGKNMGVMCISGRTLLWEQSSLGVR